MFLTSEQFSAIAASCHASPVGKLLPKALYVHTSALPSLPTLLQDYERQGRVTDKIAGATLVKFNTDSPKISYLFYPEFDSSPHPALHASIVVDLQTQQFSHWDYSNADNPPLLHRKETFVTPDYPHYEAFAHLTRLEEALGLLDNARAIGTRRDWEQRLNRHHLVFAGHHLACELKPVLSAPIERHRAALPRKNLSLPVRLALAAGLLIPGETTFFDYGCGYGSDVEGLRELGYVSAGWDPHYRPDRTPMPADIVNLGYIINVIENPQERRDVLLAAWQLTRRVLVVAAQVLLDDRDRGIVAYGDGVITRRNTFQKYYEQEELKAYIDRVLGVDAIPAGLGIYFVFRDEAQSQEFRLSRFHSQLRIPRIQAKIRRFEDYQEMLVPLMDFLTERGRLPIKGELENESELLAEFGTFRRAFKLILQVTQLEDWDAITIKRRQELLLYLALSHFDCRPKLRELAPEVKADLKGLFGGYKQACLLADMMLLSLQDLSNIAKLCEASPIGKKLSNALLVHVSALDSLEPLLRLYEGCASRGIGHLEDANVIKFFCDRPRISYLFFPDFDTNPYPQLQTIMEVNLGDLTVKYRDFSRENKPLILKQKERLLETVC